MQSHFATSTTREKTPAYCKKWQFKDIPALIAERPAVMNVLASWRGLPADPAMKVVRLFKVYYNVVLNDWIGDIAGEPYGFQASVVLYAPPATWFITLKLTLHGTPIESVTWPWDQADAGGRWNTHQLSKIIDWPNHVASIHVLA